MNQSCLKYFMFSIGLCAALLLPFHAARAACAAPGVANIKFQEFFKMPVGPRGLEPTDKLIALNGKKICLVGFMVRQHIPTPGVFVFAAMPLQLGDEDESLSDDLAPGAVFVHILKPATADVPYIPALIKLVGTLQLGAQNESDGHVSFVRLILDPAPARAIAALKLATNSKKSPQLIPLSLLAQPRS